MMISTRFSFLFTLLSIFLLPFYSLFTVNDFSTTRENTFAEYVTKVYTAAQNQY